MKKILFTDTHFGVKQNSITWLNSQKKFIYDQFIEYIINLHEPVEIVHLGDVFDSRSSISTMIANEVVNMFKDICNCKNVAKFTIISGNHDFYSPNSDAINTINLLLSNISDKIHILYNEKYIDGQYMYVPWYEWMDKDAIKNDIKKYDIKYIFTHADIVNEKTNLGKVKIFSGHVHIPYIKGNIYNLGSCFYLDFGDSNSQRGFYVLLDDGRLQFIENVTSIRFWRLYNDDIFNDNSKMAREDYIEIYIEQNKMSEPLYHQELNEYQKQYKNLRIIPQINQSSDLQLSDFNGYDIENIITDFIPEKLKQKFNQIIEKSKDNQ